MNNLTIKQKRVIHAIILMIIFSSMTSTWAKNSNLIFLNYIYYVYVVFVFILATKFLVPRPIPKIYLIYTLIALLILILNEVIL